MAKPIPIILIMIAACGWALFFAAIWLDGEHSRKTQAELAAAKQDISRLQSNLTERERHEGQLAQMAARIRVLKGELQDLSKRHEHALNETGATQQRLVSLQDATAALRKQHDQLAQARDQLSEQSDALHGLLASSRDRLEGIQKAIAGRSGDLASVGKRLEEIREREALARGQNEALAQDTRQRSEMLARAESQLQGVREEMAAADSKLSETRTEISNTAQQLSRLNAVLSTRTKEIATAEARLNELSKRSGSTGGQGPESGAASSR